MERDIAATLMEISLRIGEHYNEMWTTAQKIVDENERNRVRISIGDIMGLLYTGVMIPIIEEYPQLDPDR